MNEETLFQLALEKPPQERSSFLHCACAGDADLRYRVERLLLAYDNPGSFLQQPALHSTGNSPDSATQALDSEPINRIEGAKTQADSSKSTAPDDLAFLTPSTKPGSLGRLEHYEILEIVGKGGFGTVLKAFDEKLHRVVAIKVLAPDLSASGTARQRFIREARTAAAVVHEHVVTIHAVVEEHRPPYLVMQMIDGVTLQQKLDKTGTLSLREILRIGMQMAQALDAAHKQGLVHRDIKPANVLLENGVERVKITDFGLARAVDDASVTQSGTVAGTPMYMSPEQAEGLPIDHRSDLFSLGTVLYAMCTGHPPFRASGTHAVLKRVIDASPRPIREINHEVPDWLSDIIARLHAKKPEDRFQTAKEVAELLGQRLADVQAGREIQRASGVSRGSEPQPPPAYAGGSPRRRRWKWAAALLLLGATIVAGWLLFQREWIGLVTDRGRVQFSWDDPDLNEIIFKEPDGSIAYVVQRGINELEIKIGDFTLEARVKNGREPKEWSFHRERFFSRQTLAVPQATAVLPLGRGERIQIRLLLGPAPDNEPGWVQLFNHKDIEGWQTHPDHPGKWEVKDRILVASGPRSYLFKKIDFDRFHLRAKVQVNDGGTGSICFRVPDIALADNKLPAGYIVQINSNTTLPMKTGALWHLSEPKGLRTTSLPPPRPGEWFDLEILSDDGVTETRVNGKQAVLDVETIKRPFGRFIVLECMGPNSILQFKSVEIKELPGGPVQEPGWVQLFNRKDLDGWKAVGPREIWRVQDGNLVGGGNHGHLFTEREYENFHFKVEAKFVGKIDSGQLFRSKPGSHQGYEAQIGGDTGTLQRHQPGQTAFLFRNKDNSVPADKWFTQEVIALGSRLIVKLDGETLVDTVDEQHRRGHLALQSFNREGTAYFRKIEIKELPPGEPALPLTWRRVPVADAGFSVMLPPDPEKHEIPLPEGRKMKAVGAEDPPGNPVFLALAVLMDANLKSELAKDPNEGFRRLLRGAGNNGDVGQVKRIKFGDLSGSEIVVRDPKSGKTWFVRVFVINDHVAVLAAAGDGENPPPLVQAYLNSLRVEEPRPPEPDEKRIQGTWKAISGKKVGAKAEDVEIFDEEKLARWELTFEGNRMRSRMIPGATFKLGPDNRLTVEWKFAQRTFTMNGAYRLDQDRLTIELTELPPLPPDPPGKERERKTLMLVLKRQELTPEELGWVQLFDRKDMDGWTPHSGKPNGWKVENGILVGRSPESYLYVKAPPADKAIHLRAEARINDGGAGAVILHANADATSGCWAPINSTHNSRKTGHLYGTALNFMTDPGAGTKTVPKPGEWFKLEMISENGLVTVRINGETTSQINVGARFGGADRIGLYVGGEKSVIEFKSIEIKELPVNAKPPEPKDKWNSLFDGKTLDGWWVNGLATKWEVKNGAIVCAAPEDTPPTKVFGLSNENRKNYRNFHLRVEAKVGSGGHAGVWFRAPPSTAREGYWAVLNFDNTKDSVKTGGLRCDWGPEDKTPVLIAAAKPAAPADKWCTLEVIAQGTEITVKIDGEVTGKINDSKYSHGRVVLHAWGLHGAAAFRKVEIKELP